MWVLCLLALCCPAWSQCPTKLINSGMNNTAVASNALFGWSKTSTAKLAKCGNKTQGQGGVLKITRTSYFATNVAVYQTVSTNASAQYTVSCDFYDYDYAQLDVVSGSDPLVTSFPGFPISSVTYGGWQTISRLITTPTSTTTMTVFGNRVCIRNCAFIPAQCGTIAPTPAPISAPVLSVSVVLSTGVTVYVTSLNSGSYTTRCVGHTGPLITNVTAFWNLALSSTVIEMSNLPSSFTFTGFQSFTFYMIQCSCSNGLRSSISTQNVNTLRRCNNNVTCPLTSRCVDTLDGTTPMCSPYFDGVKSTNSLTPCRQGNGTSPFFTNLTTTLGGDNLTVCLAVGNNTNAATYSSAIQFYYGTNVTSMPCSNQSFSAVTNIGGVDYLTATCVTSPGVGRTLTFSMTFLPPNAQASVTVSTSDAVSYPAPTIVPGTSRFADIPGDPRRSSLTSPSADKVVVAFDVTNIAPYSPLLRVFYGPDDFPFLLECALERDRMNYSTIVCGTDPTTPYSAAPYKWTVVTGDASVRGNDTFNLAVNFPRVLFANSTSCSNDGVRVSDCPTVGNTFSNPVRLTVFGNNFGIGMGPPPRVLVDGVFCPTISMLAGVNSSDYVICALPAGTGFNRNVYVQVDAKFSSPLPLVSYSGPTITKMCGCDTPCPTGGLSIENCARGGGGNLTVFGASFGLQGASVLIGSSACIGVTHDAVSPHTQITCQLPEGVSVHSSVIVIQQNGPNSAGGALAQLSFALCEPGTIQDGVLIQCSGCTPGKYAPLAGQIECLPCAPGSFSNTTRQTTCTACPIGMYQTDSNSTQCNKCDVGFFATSSGLSACTSCAPGTFMNDTGAVDCKPCPSGSFVTTPHATECFLCSPGSYANVNGQSVCASCDSGTYSNTSGVTTCTSCEPGWFMGSIGQSLCQPCNAGRYAISTGASVCRSCPAGTFSNASASTICMNCEKGFIQILEGERGCEQCNDGQISNPEGVSCSDCPAGRRANADVCVSCEPGTYQNLPAKSSCNNCPPGKAVDVAGATDCPTCAEGMLAATEALAKCTPCPSEATQKGTSPPACACRPRFYMNYNQTCSPCTEGMQCEEYGIVEVSVLARYGYLRIGNLTLFRACLDATYCPGGLTHCAPFRTGPLCNTCLEGYRPVEGEPQCSECPKEGTSASYIAIVAILLLLGLTLLYVFMLRTDMALFATMGPKRRQWWHENEKEDPVDPGLRLSTEEPEVDPDDSPIVDMRPESRIKKTLSYQFKIFITFLQLSTALLSLSAVNWPPSFQFFISGLEFINLNFLPWNYVGCIQKLRLFDKIMLTAFFPPLFLLIIGGPLMAILWCLEKRDQSDKDDSRLKRAQLKSIFWRVIVFTLFLCYPAVSRQIITYFRCVEVPNEFGSPEYYLLSSFSEQCYDEQWYNLLAPVVIALLLYPIGIPLGLLWALVHFRPWFRDANMLYSLGLAYSGFHPEFWWFELLDMLHKLTLTCLVALFVLPQDQITAALVVAAAYVLVLLICMPYLRLHDNLLHMLAQVEVFLLILGMQCGGRVSDEIQGGVTDVLVSGMLILMVVAVMTAFLILIVHYLRLSYLRKLQKRRQLEKSSGTATMETDPLDEAAEPKPPPRQ